MSPGMLKMYISFAAMLLMFIAVIGTIFAREKLNGFLKNIVLTFTFLCMVVSGIIVFLVVFSGPIEG